MEGETTISIQYIIEIIVAIFTGILIVGAILFVSNTDYIAANSISSQLSYISSLDQGDSTQISLTLPDKSIEVSSSNNEVRTKVEKSEEVGKDYIGDKTISSNPGNIIIIN